MVQLYVSHLRRLLEGNGAEIVTRATVDVGDAVVGEQSRGAAHVTFLDNDAKAIRLIGENVANAQTPGYARRRVVLRPS